jgi:hypothetical protein
VLASRRPEGNSLKKIAARAAMGLGHEQGDRDIFRLSSDYESLLFSSLLRNCTSSKMLVRSASMC